MKKIVSNHAKHSSLDLEPFLIKVRNILYIVEQF